jgi:rhamnose transport system permease protein
MTAQRALRRLSSWDVVVGVLVVAVLLGGEAIANGVLSDDTVFFTLTDIGEVLLIALPMTMLIIAGHIDLSVGAAVALSGAVIGKLYSAGVPMGLACVGGIATGVACGMFNGVLVSRVGLHSLAVTIGTLGLYRGLSFVLLGNTPVGGFPTTWTAWAYNSYLGWFPRTLPLLVVAVAFFGWLLHWTKTGRSVYALGTNVEAARFSGVRVNRLTFGLFVATGTMAGISGVIYTLRFASAIPNAATGLELAVIAAVLFGGVSIFGGVGGLLGVVNAVLFLGFTRAVLRLLSVPPNVLTVVTGLLLLTSVVAPALIGKLRERRTRPRRSPIVERETQPTPPVRTRVADAPEPEAPLERR